MNYITDHQIDSIAGDTGEALRSEGRVALIIAPLPGTENIPWEGGINGHFFRIRRGVQVEVPKSVAELIRQNEQVNILSELSVKPYKRGGGKRLGAMRGSGE